MIRIVHKCHSDGELSFVEKNLTKIIEYFNMNEMHKTYQVTYLRVYFICKEIFRNIVNQEF